MANNILLCKCTTFYEPLMSRWASRLFLQLVQSSNEHESLGISIIGYRALYICSKELELSHVVILSLNIEGISTLISISVFTNQTVNSSKQVSLLPHIQVNIYPFPSYPNWDDIKYQSSFPSKFCILLNIVVVVLNGQSGNRKEINVN